MGGLWWRERGGCKFVAVRRGAGSGQGDVVAPGVQFLLVAVLRVGHGVTAGGTGRTGARLPVAVYDEAVVPGGGGERG